MRMKMFFLHIIPERGALLRKIYPFEQSNAPRSKTAGLTLPSVGVRFPKPIPRSIFKGTGRCAINLNKER
jgi:hypothetical protein